MLAYFTHGPGIVFNTKRPVTKVEDLQGLKWRVGGGMVNEISKTLGMNVTLKPAPESYELLSGGVMDGTLFPAESTESFKIDKLIKHATFFPGGLYNTSFVFMMNQAKYDKLSAEEKKAVDAMSGETAARIIGRGLGQGGPPRHGADAGQRRADRQGRREVRRRRQGQDLAAGSTSGSRTPKPRA